MAPTCRQRYALVTGCGAGGIGEALVTEYARQGFSPIATVLPSESSDHLDSMGILSLTLDVTEEESVERVKSQVEKLTNGCLDVLVNNAGICYTMTAIDTDVAAAQRMFDVNVLGPMRMVHQFHTMIVKNRGIIVNIGSVGGIVPYVYGASYNASKAALHHWSNTLRVEMAPLGVRVLTVISGNIGTNILKSDSNRELPLNSYFSPLAADFKSHVRRVPDTTNRFEYAARVVAESQRKKPPTWFWYGNTTWVVWFLDTFAPKGVWDFFMEREFHFYKLQSSQKD